MKIFKNVALVGAVAATFALTGCASIVSGHHEEVTFNTSTGNGSVKLFKEGNLIEDRDAPFTETLNTRHSYSATAYNECGNSYSGTEIGRKNNWWILGNVPFGFVGIAGIVIDASTGSSKKFERDNYVLDVPENECDKTLVTSD